MKQLIIILFAITIGLTSCAELADQSLPNDVVFFDLKKFIAQEVTRLDQEKPMVKKTTRVNEVNETKTLKLDDFEMELKIFTESDINKMAWIEKYSVDTTYQNNQLSKIHYKAKEEKLITRDLIVDYINGKVSKIEIQTQASSIVTDVEKHLMYEPNVGYSILSKQKTTGSASNEIEINAIFQK